jgi:hypothetical protein
MCPAVRAATSVLEVPSRASAVVAPARRLMVGRLDPVGVHGDQASDAEVGRSLDEQGADPAGPDEGCGGAAQPALPVLTERADLAVVPVGIAGAGHGVHSGTSLRGWSSRTQASSGASRRGCGDHAPASPPGPRTSDAARASAGHRAWCLRTRRG